METDNKDQNDMPGQIPAKPSKDVRSIGAIGILTTAFRRKVSRGENAFVMTSLEAEEWQKQLGIDQHEFLRKAALAVASLAVCPVSNFKVGAAALGASGTVYFGVNLEFVGLPLSSAVHGEQFLITNAITHNEKSLLLLSVNAVPCGHCRQFLKELHSVESLRFILDKSLRLTSLAQLLPMSFGPLDLGNADRLLTHRAVEIEATGAHAVWEGDAAVAVDEGTREAAERGFRASYAPYSKVPCGVGVRVNKTHAAAATESAAAVTSTSTSAVTSTNLRAVDPVAAEAVIKSVETVVESREVASSSAATETPSPTALPPSGVSYLSGPTLESAAFNPTLLPFHTLSVRLHLQNTTWAAVDQVTITETSGQVVSATRTLAAWISVVATKIPSDAVSVLQITQFHIAPATEATTTEVAASPLKRTKHR